jgi:hypothetical protein
MALPTELVPLLADLEAKSKDIIEPKLSAIP